jgi:hypothetical protein
MTLEKLPACLAFLLLSACRTIDAPAQGGDSGDTSAEDDSSGAAVDGSGSGDPGVSTTAAATMSTAGSTTSDDGDSAEATSGTDPDETGTDPSDTGEGSTGADADSSSTGAVEPTPCASTCVALPGGEWQGPVRLEIGATGDASPGCSDVWGAAVDELFSDLVAPPAVCDCSCGDAQDVMCSETLTLNRKANNGASCAVAAILDSYELSPGCNPINETDQNTRWDLVVPGPEGGSCDPIAEAMIEPAAFTTRYTLCGESAPAPGVCNGDQTCVADTDAPLCVYADGDVACPGDGFGVKHVVYGPDVADTRSCTACTCGEPEGTCVTSGVDLYDFDNACVPELFDVPLDMPAAGCVVSPFAVFDASYPNSAIPAPQTSCAAGESDAQGDVAAQGPITMCCNG